MRLQQEYPERSIQDYNQWHNGMIGKVFYTLCPDDKNYYRTIRLHLNPFINAIRPQISNAVYGTPPDGMKEINPTLLQRVMRMPLADTPFF
tara:strand:+ start:890 stop:1162 length:273 start_codon:yes stop_codon:yes gene_type:complete